MRLKNPELLRLLMKQHDFSLARLARYAGCSKGFISHLLSGRRKTCTAPLGARISEALQVPVDVLFDVIASPTGGQAVREDVPA